MNLKIGKWIAFICLMLVFSVSHAQILPRGLGFKKKDMFGPNLFQYHISEFMAEEDPGLSRLDVEVVFANDILQFVKNRGGDFTARYDLVVSVFDDKENLVDEKSAYEKISVKRFADTNSRTLDRRHRFSFTVRAGKYRVLISLTDLDTQKSLRREKELEIKGFLSPERFISNILFAEGVTIDTNGTIEIEKTNVSSRFYNPDSSFWAYFEIYPKNLTDSLLLRYSIYERNEKRIAFHEESFSPDSKIIPYLIDLSKFIEVTGQYKLVVYATQNKVAQNLTINFSVVWRNQTFKRMNTDLMLKVMRDLIPGDDYKFLQTASDSARRAYFREYWKKRDPTPGTERNELLEEYTRRVEFANNYFSVQSLNLEGWQTDRGKIYIKYGQPTEVDRRMDDIDLPPFEIWYYEHLRKRFIFEDKSGVGDFRLVRIE